LPNKFPTIRAAEDTTATAIARSSAAVSAGVVKPYLLSS
jgi:hypothetical protein